MSPFSDEEEDIDDLEDRDLPRNPAGKEHSMKRRALQQCPRECLMVLHRAKFLQGEIYHVLGASQSDKEDASYAAAETLRKDLLKATEESANQVMTLLRADIIGWGVDEESLQIPVPTLDGGYLRSTHLIHPCQGNDVPVIGTIRHSRRRSWTGDT
ncbi:hypothetical protein M405DRAFT_934254 [Rhizopogon salebrosus TDB-379]|nr:hypothetical protein M405DRAFT_934254 [Rhizopogon salebrosus TDB-379]